MPKDRVDMSYWSEEDYIKEYDLISKKISKLPASQRAFIVSRVNSNREKVNETK